MVASSSEGVDERSFSTIGSRRVGAVYVIFFTEDCTATGALMGSNYGSDIVLFRNRNFGQF